MFKLIIAEKKGKRNMKLDRYKYELACARACMDAKDIVGAGFPHGTLNKALGGSNMRPGTAGKLAKILGCDITEIIEIKQED